MTIIAYHFTGTHLRDGRTVPAVGETLIHDGPIEWCRSGLYASRKPHQALQYAPGHFLHRVECDEIAREDEDKLVCRRRTIVTTLDAKSLLRRFAADQALSVAHLWDMPTAVRDYLISLDGRLRLTAKAAAWAAAENAERETEREASWASAWASARTAERAAKDAAKDASWASSGTTTRNAAWVAAMVEFDARVNAALKR